MNQPRMGEGCRSVLVGTARCAVRAAFSGAMRTFDHRGLQEFRPLYAAGDPATAGRRPYLGVMQFLLLLSLLVLSGCGKSPALVGAEETELLGPQYSSKNGLLLPEETSRSLGVKIVEVTEQQIPATIDFQLRFFQTGTNGGTATGSLPAEQAKQLNVGELWVEVRMPDGGHRSGQILALSADPSRPSELAEVLVRISGATEKFSSSDFLQASAPIRHRKTSVAIPASALLRSVDGYFVYTRNGKHLLRTPVKVGVSNADLVEISEGLFAGDEVVSDAVMSLWMIELAAVKGGQACCVVPAKGK